MRRLICLALLVCAGHGIPGTTKKGELQGPITKRDTESLLAELPPPMPQHVNNCLMEHHRRTTTIPIINAFEGTKSTTKYWIYQTRRFDSGVSLAAPPNMTTTTTNQTPTTDRHVREKDTHSFDLLSSRRRNRQEQGDVPDGSLVVPLHLLGILSYLGLLGWFSNRMKQQQEYYDHQHNTIEEWIGRTIAVGLCAVVLRCLEYLLYDHTGDRHPVVAAVTAFGYATKHGLTRALLVGLSTGVGVLPNRLSSCTVILLVTLTLAYIAIVTGLDYWAFVQDHRQDENDDGGDDDDDNNSVRESLLVSKACMEVMFWLWMWCGLCQTISALRRNNNRPDVISRYRCLFWILILLAALSGAVFGAVVTEKTDYGSVGLASNRGLSQLDEMCVFFMLLTAAILWRPRQHLMEQPDLEMMQSMTESNPDIPDDSPLFGANSTFS